MHTVQLKIDNSIYDNVMFFLRNLNLKGLKIESDKEEAKDIEEILNNPECYEISHSKIISL
jgi:hypothetical protein